MFTLKNLVFTVFLVIGFFAMAPTIQAQIPEEIFQSLKSGNAKKLAGYFNQNIELVVLENDNVYSKAQAQQIVDQFFSANSPEAFNIIHQGGKEGAQYVIGSLVTSKKSYRVYFLLKKSDGKDYIHQLRIEDQ